MHTHIYMHAYARIHTFRRQHRQSYSCTCICLHIYALIHISQAYVYVHTHIHTCIHAYICSHTHIQASAQTIICLFRRAIALKRFRERWRKLEVGYTFIWMTAAVYSVLFLYERVCVCMLYNSKDVSRAVEETWGRVHIHTSVLCLYERVCMHAI